MNLSEGVSVIICCHNSEARIITTLQYLQGQEFSRPVSWEVIVVDNASTDQTTAAAYRQWSINPVTSLSVVEERQPGLMFARYRGLSAARYGIVSFIDDDNWVESGWVEKVFFRLTGNEQIGACGGRVLPAFEDAPPPWFAEFQNSFAVGEQMARSGIIDRKGFLWGAGLSFRLSIWKELQQRGFSNITVGREGKSLNAGEDTELCYAIRLLGYSLYYDEELVLQHYMPAARLKWDYLEKMTVGFGKANVRLNYYRAILPQGLTLKHWLREWLYAVKEYGRNLFESLYMKKGKEKRRKRILACYYKGTARQLWADKGLYRRITVQLQKTFPTSNLAQPGVQQLIKSNTH